MRSVANVMDKIRNMLKFGKFDQIESNFQSKTNKPKYSKMVQNLSLFLSLCIRKVVKINTYQSSMEE